MAFLRELLLPPESATPLFDAEGNSLPSLRDKGVWLLLGCALILTLLAWHLSEGYPIADSVEYMERARTLVRGERIIDAGAIRPFGFSLLLTPVYLLADWIGLLDPRPVLWAICLVQILLSLLLVYACVRLGARIGGRRTGLVAGFLVATNPIFLTYCAMPISGIGAAVCIAFGLESLWERGNARREWIGALWLAAAVLMIYQCALIVGTIALCLVLRDRRQSLRPLRSILLALVLAVLVQVLLDRLVYGAYGISVRTYLFQKPFGMLSSLSIWLLKFTGWGFFKRAALWFNSIAFSQQGDSYTLAEDLTPHSIQPPLWYFQHLPQMLVWPVLALLVCALVAAVRRPNWRASFLWLVFLFNLAALTLNSSKDFRLWLPLMPCVAPLCAWGGRFGWSSFGEHARARGENTFWRRIFTVSMAGATAVLALTPFLELNRREFGGYWRAMDYVNTIVREAYPSRRAQAERTVEGAPPPKVRVAFDYNWAVFQRESPLVDLVKLPWQLNLWKNRILTEAKKNELYSVLPDFDILVLHDPILRTNPDLHEWVNRHYQVCGALYDQRTYAEGLGPIYVLSRRRGSSADNIFFDVKHEDAPARFEGLRGLEHGLDFAREDGSERLELLGWEYRRLPPEGLGWIMYHWYSPTGLHTPWTLLDRLTSADEKNAWQNNHGPAWGTLPSEQWPAQTRVSEGYLVVPSTDPYRYGAPYRPIGGGFRRGDLIPVRLWMRVVYYDPLELAKDNDVVLDRLQPVMRSDKGPLSPNGDGTFQSPDGTQWSVDDMVRVGSFFIPVQEAARVPDDGRPIPEDH